MRTVICDRCNKQVEERGCTCNLYGTFHIGIRPEEGKWDLCNDCLRHVHTAIKIAVDGPTEVK